MADNEMDTMTTNEDIDNWRGFAMEGLQHAVEIFKNGDSHHPAAVLCPQYHLLSGDTLLYMFYHQVKDKLNELRAKDQKVLTKEELEQQFEEEEL